MPRDPLDGAGRGRRPRHPGHDRLDERGVPAVVRAVRRAAARMRWSTLTLARIAARVPGEDRASRTHPVGPKRCRARCSARSCRTCCCAARSPASPTAGRMRAAPTYVYEFRWRSPRRRHGRRSRDGARLRLRPPRPPPTRSRSAAPTHPRRSPMPCTGRGCRFVIDGDPGWERWSERRPVQAFDADGGHIDYAPRADELAGLPAR